ncbi:RBP11-like subunits of RNA polymerase [Rhizodiscina lignyota]|uniref:RBP11-like subunits of RNA polymerase n=1 Tax=Rhizodiscina lignyota TaxID=1504668 RepID=A0A9P4M2X6_9PEZI|nr:RBP11-like subunits of RNA polymerase [Rhizodiscina lignyota]
MASENQDMPDAGGPVQGLTDARARQEEERQDAILVDDEQKIHVLPGSTDTSASFEFLHEDHTLGNALRYIITKNPVVELCAYSIPHPSEPKMHLRIQTFADMEDNNVYDVLRKGLMDLQDLCDVVTENFTTARDKFVQENGST